MAGKYFGLFFVQCEGFEICGLISSQQGRDNSLPQELFENVWRVFVVVVVTITGKNDWHLVERGREVENLALGRTVIFQKSTEKH